jgi:1A family penicillin-binding protein
MTKMTADDRSSDGARSSSGEALRHLLRAIRTDLAGAFSRVFRSRAPSPKDGGHSTGFLPWIFGVAKFALVAIVLALLVVSAGILWVLRELPLNDTVVTQRDREILLEASDGKPIGRVGPLKVSNAERSDFPPALVSAVIAIEDRRFFDHWGVDPTGIARAAARNYFAGTVVEGGSTITQQLVKLKLLSNERTFARKLREALAALWLETRLSKDEILTSYLNSVYLGAGIQGMSAGAKFYFDKRLTDLSLPEAALLAGLVKAPSRYNPLHNLDGAHKRAELVLDAMVQSGAIDQHAAAEAKAHPAMLRYSADPSGSGTWFSDWAAAEARETTGSIAGTLRVRTTLEPKLQDIAERVIADALKEEGADRNVSQAALVAMKPNGAVVAMVGGRDYKESQFNRAVQAQRQPGSAFKLFVYLAALRHGFSPSDTIEDAPLEIDGWEPENYGGTYRGNITLADAFARSSNAAAVRLSQKVGIDEVIKTARDLGISTPLPKVPSIALGAADVNLLDLTVAYGSVLTDRYPVHPWGIAAFTPQANPRLVTMGPPAHGQQSLGAAREPMLDLLKGVVERGTGRAASLEGLAAGKTGTSQNYRDAWFVGFNDNLIVGVWVGNDDRSPMDHVTGGSLPAAIWHKFMLEATPLAVAHEPVEIVPAAPAPATHAEESLPQTEPALDQAAGMPTPPDAAQCDVRACAAQYQSFNLADCTYQPYGGSRRVRCERGSMGHRQQAEVLQQGASAPAASVPGQCNVSACTATYSSFDAATCTYQPYDGGARRACTK